MNKENQKELVCEFLITFAQFEQALKSSGYVMGDGQAQANWLTFADEGYIQKDFDNPDSPIVEEIEFILDQPPRRQIVHNGKPGWDTAPVNQDLKSKTALLYLCRVRNNLFHGGKFENGLDLRERDLTLISISIQILKRCADLLVEVMDKGENQDNTA